MAYQATVIPVMIASPSDVLDERNAARDVINEWNYINSYVTNAVLMPMGWETHSSPELGTHPQKLINERVLEKCDLLVGIFWTRVGTPTDESVSGSVEEIEQHVKAGKPAMVYFSTKPAAPQTVDKDQFEALSRFRTWCEEQGLVQTFDSVVDFERKFSKELGITLNTNESLTKLLKRSVEASSEEELTLAYVAGGKPKLSDEALELLHSAVAGRSGQILKRAFIGGRRIQTNGKSFGDSKDRRSMARWEFALNQLIELGLVVARGHKGEIFEVTEQGYRWLED